MKVNWHFKNSLRDTNASRFRPLNFHLVIEVTNLRIRIFECIPKIVLNNNLLKIYFTRLCKVSQIFEP